MKEKLKRNFLIVLVNNKEDFRIAMEHHWYRIPCKTKIVPEEVKDGSLEYIGFYQTKAFEPDSYRVNWYGIVKNISVVKRKELLPGIFNDPKANDDYYKINFSKLIRTPYPIISQRGRRLLFIPTTFTRFQAAKEINDLFFESPLEERLWENLKASRICAERQYMYSTTKQKFYLDFALFCRLRNIDIECDGDKYHLSPQRVLYDKRRNNFLESYGWSVLRFSSEDINQQIWKTIDRIKQTINQSGGLEIVKNFDYRYFDMNDNTSLFNEPK